MMNTSYHPAILSAVKRHQEFFNGTRKYLIKVKMDGYDFESSGIKGYKESVGERSQEERQALEAMEKRLVPEVPYDGLNWDLQFQDYYKSRVENGKIKAEYRLNLGLDDDYIPTYFPYFGIAIHHAFFGAKLNFRSGTSYTLPLIESAEQWQELHFSTDNVWTQRLAEAMSYCRDNGDGLLLASLRGANGPMDMANAVLGNELFTEFVLDEENIDHLMEVCKNASLAMINFQRQFATVLDGGTICPQGNLWMPLPMFGHLASDAAHMVGPKTYSRFEKPLIEEMAETCGGFLFHTHMMGHQMHKCFADTKGISIIRPVDDPNQPTVCDKIDSLLEQIGDTPLMFELPRERITDVIPKFQNRKGIFELTAHTTTDALEQMQMIRKILD